MKIVNTQTKLFDNLKEKNDKKNKNGRKLMLWIKFFWMIRTFLITITTYG